MNENKDTGRALLLSAPYIKEYMRNARCDFVSLSATQWYPILLGSLGAYLQGKGYEARLLDAPAHYMDHAQAARAIREYKPDLIVLYTGRMSEDNDIEFAEPLVEEIKCDAVIIGPYASIDPIKTLGKTKVIDKLVSGEFESAVGMIMDGAKPANIPNLLYKDNGEVKRNPERPYMNTEELDSIPFVSKYLYENVDVWRYKTPSEHYPFMDILTGRGCKWGFCTYCLWVHTYVKGMTYNMRSMENVIEELKVITTDMPKIKSIMIQDDTFTAQRARDFSEAKMRAGIRLPWSCYARGDMDMETMSLMKKAGCRNLHVGFESADPKVLKTIKKGLSKKTMTLFADNAKRAGLGIHGDFAMGFPGETPEGAQKTIDWACEMNPDTAQFQLMIPFPGTPYYDMMKSNGWLNKDGEPDMPQFSNDQIRAMAKKAYRAFYLHPRHAWKCIKHPQEHFFGRMKTMYRAVPAMFWKRW